MKGKALSPDIVLGHSGDYDVPFAEATRGNKNNPFPDVSSPVARYQKELYKHYVGGFHSKVVAGAPGHRPHDRHVDAEIKILSEIKSKVLTELEVLKFDDRVSPGRISPQIDVTGEVHLTSDFIICDSCKGVIAQFKDLFPSVDIIAQEIEINPKSNQFAAGRGVKILN